MSALDLDAIEARQEAAHFDLRMAATVINKDVSELLARVRELEAEVRILRHTEDAGPWIDATLAAEAERQRCLDILLRYIEPYMAEDDHICPLDLWQDVKRAIEQGE